MECPATWKPLHSKTYDTLVLFKKAYLSVESNRRAFGVEVLAYVSLQKEQWSPIRAADISERANLLYWAVKTLGLPMGNFHVELLGDAACKRSISTIRPSSLITLIRSSGEDELCVIMEEDTVEQRPRHTRVARPVLQEDVERLPTLPMLCSTQQRDHDLVAEMAGTTHSEATCTTLALPIPAKQTPWKRSAI